MTLKVSDKIKEKKMYDNLDDDKIGELKNGDNKKKNVTNLILMKRNC